MLSAKSAVPHHFGNRLRAVPGLESYRYDGLGRRVMSAKASGAQTLWQYSQAGQLLFAWKGPTAQTTHEYVYLAGSLVATIDHAWPSNAITATKYQHTDALGSPIAMSNEAGTAIERTNYDPYGGPIGKVVDGIGYTGHVMDGLTGLTNMQQRYYDQGVGRFLSVDPVSASSINGGNFNRYWYANNNPYKFTDPDGRLACKGFIRGPGPSACDGNDSPWKKGAPPVQLSKDKSAESKGGENWVERKNEKAQDLVGGVSTSVLAAKAIAANSAGESLDKVVVGTSEAAGWRTLGLRLTYVGTVISGSLAVVEINDGLATNDAAKIGHGAAGVGVMLLSTARLISPQAALTIGVIDTGVSQAEWTNPDGTVETGWRAVGAAAAHPSTFVVPTYR